MTQLCNRCKSWVPLPGDTWCIGCSAAEELRAEFTRGWSAAYRRIAHDLVASTVRSVKALRNLSSGVQSAIQSEVAKRTQPPNAGPAVRLVEPKGEERKEKEDERSAIPRRRTTTPKRKPSPEKGGNKRVRSPSFENEGSEEEDETEEESGAPDPGHSPIRDTDNRKPPEPDHPPPGSRKKESEAKRNQGDRHHNPQGRTSHRPRESRGRRPGHRAGRKHQRLHRLLIDPTTPVHRQPAASFWALQETLEFDQPWR